METYWTGPEYEGRRLLLLGESAYSHLDAEGILVPLPEGHARDLVLDAIGGAGCRFMNVLTRGLAGQRWPDEEARRAAWSGAVFLNYVADTVGDRARVRPAASQWEAAKTRFKGLLEALQPRTAIILGKQIWRNLPEANIWLTDDVQVYRAGNGETCVCWAVDHPAAYGMPLGWERLATLIRFAETRDLPDAPCK